MKILFMLPARSGSKGVPDKNIKELHGHPLMWYMIHSIKQSEIYKEHECYIVVNTDSEEYAKVAMECGADKYLIRDASLASDTSQIKDTIKATMSFYEDEEFDLFALMQVTSPLLESKDIDTAIRMFEDRTIYSVLSVAESEVMPLWCNTLSDDLSMDNFMPLEIRTKNRQELPSYYRLTGALRIARWTEYILNEYDFMRKGSRALILEQRASLDIDTIEDFMYAEFLMDREK